MNNRDQALLTASQAHCKKIVDGSGSNFRMSFSFLKPEDQRSMHSLYAFARLVDDVADDKKCSLSSGSQAGQLMHEWLGMISSSKSEDISSLIARIDQSSVLERLGTNADEQSFLRITPAVWDLTNRFAVSDYLDAIIYGAEFDLNSGSQIVDAAGLERYCDWVASSVGLACLHIWNAHSPTNMDYAVHCGRAFQLTNILRDVAEDAAAGRIYLPQRDREEFGCSKSNWLACKPDGDWKALMDRYISRAFDHYEASYRLIQFLPLDAGRMFSLMWHAYRTLLTEVRTNLDSVWKQRIRLSYTQKTRLYLQHAITPLYMAKNRR